ncbi:LacI family transcriptional regulator [bacterium]|nr:MAG: LacI family transcriptional regulator [bacterium]
MKKDPEPKLGSGKSRSKLTDVAALAGVSTSTVSLVLAGKGEANRISEETHRRVHEAAATLNYAPSLLHRSVRRGRTNILSFYNSFRNRYAGDLYMDRISAAVEHAGGQHRYNVLVHCHFEQTVQETYEFLNGGFADGLILFAPTPDEPLLPLLRRSGLPTVIVNPRGPEEVLSTVEDDAQHGMRLVAESLIQNGHRRIAIVTRHYPGWPDSQRREEFLRGWLAEFGVPEQNVHTIIERTQTPDEHDRVLAEFLDLPERPTALFVWNDRTAYDLLDTCLRAGIDVPGELSIVGYDGIAWPTTTGHIVSSVRAPFEDLADAAVVALDRQIRGDPGPFHIQVPGTSSSGTTLAPAAL